MKKHNTLINYLTINKTNAKFSIKSNNIENSETNSKLGIGGGILFNFAGRLKGAQRAKKMQLSYGKINTQTFNSSIKFSQKQIFTKWGTLGSTVFISR